MNFVRNSSNGKETSRDPGTSGKVKDSLVSFPVAGPGLVLEQRRNYHFVGVGVKLVLGNGQERSVVGSHSDGRLTDTCHNHV